MQSILYHLHKLKRYHKKISIRKKEQSLNYLLNMHNYGFTIDRMRRKQAEFLVKNHVPATCICGLIVTTSEQEQKAKDILTKVNSDIKIFVDTKHKYFYP